MRVRVPATSANLGPGFDCLGLAVGLYLEVKASLSPTDHFHYRGEGWIPDTPDNLIHRGFRQAFAAFGRQAPTITFEVENPIPLARGLGSSSAALVAGAAVADMLLEEMLGPDGVFQLTAEMEGHPDNVGPAVYGGFTVSAKESTGTYLSQSFSLPQHWVLLFGIPDFELPTEKARSVLPKSYCREDVIFNTSRTALWGLAVVLDRPELLRVASQDALHEPYRAKLVPGLQGCQAELLQRGAYATFLSGAGPTLGVICSSGSKAGCIERLRQYAGSSGQVIELEPGSGYRTEVLTSPPAKP
ncbi:MAG: homoserine kinase [Trueperaceae bacterium]|nr:MAG: homoserine kinase [Trueperaceae bacterium]